MLLGPSRPANRHNEREVDQSKQQSLLVASFAITVIMLLFLLLPSCVLFLFLSLFPLLALMATRTCSRPPQICLRRTLRGELLEDPATAF
eukprot:6179063-Pyramimonas_sp.AAC.1